MTTAAAGTDIALKDGSTLHVRPIRPEDAQSLAALYAGMSEDSRVFRFFSSGANLRKAAERSADLEEGRGLVALLAGHGRVVGHAEFARTGRHEAEVAFAVADEWHGHGISTLLLAQLAELAAADGVSTFVAYVMPGNHKMVGVFRGSGFPVEVRSVEGELEITFPTALDAAGRRRFEERERTAAVAAVRHVLRPASVAVIGATTTVGAAVLRNLAASGFRGPLHAVTSPGDEVRGLATHRSVVDVPGDVELAVVAVPAGDLTAVARECTGKGVRALVVVSDGVAESWTEGAAARAELLSVCRGAGIRLVGPGSLGVLNTADGFGLHATSAPQAPLPGRLAFASQSAAFGLVAMDLAARRGLGLSSVVSLGDKLDLSGNDVLQYWDEDPSTDVIALYLESFGNPGKFGRIARRIAACKPVVAVKSGRSLAGAADAASPTARLVATEAGVDALFRHAGVIRTETVDELLDVASLLTREPLPQGDRVTVVANARGPGIVCADACADAGLRVEPLSTATATALRAAVPRATVENPLDLTAAATAEDFRRAVGIVLDDPAVDAVITVFVSRLAAAAAEVLDVLRAAVADDRSPVVPVFLGPGRPAPAPALPVLESVEEAARALGHVVRYARHRAAPEDPVPDLPGVDSDRAAGIIAAALKGGGDFCLAPRVVDELLACYGLERTAAAPSGVQVLVGAVGDPRFGPLVAVGAGGKAAKLMGDVEVRLAPVGARTAASMVRGLRSFPLLAGYRGAPGADVAAVEDLVLRVGALAAAHPEVVELDLDPVVASPAGAAIAGARVRIGPPPPSRPLGALDR